MATLAPTSMIHPDLEAGVEGDAFVQAVITNGGGGVTTDAWGIKGGETPALAMGTLPTKGGVPAGAGHSAPAVSHAAAGGPRAGTNGVAVAHEGDKHHVCGGGAAAARLNPDASSLPVVPCSPCGHAPVAMPAAGPCSTSAQVRQQTGQQAQVEEEPTGRGGDAAAAGSAEGGASVGPSSPLATPFATAHHEAAASQGVHMAQVAAAAAPAHGGGFGASCPSGGDAGEGSHGGSQGSHGGSPVRQQQRTPSPSRRRMATGTSWGQAAGDGGAGDPGGGWSSTKKVGPRCEPCSPTRCASPPAVPMQGRHSASHVGGGAAGHHGMWHGSGANVQAACHEAQQQQLAMSPMSRAMAALGFPLAPLPYYPQQPTSAHVATRNDQISAAYGSVVMAAFGGVPLPTGAPCHGANPPHRSSSAMPTMSRFAGGGGGGRIRQHAQQQQPLPMTAPMHDDPAVPDGWRPVSEPGPNGGQAVPHWSNHHSSGAAPRRTHSGELPGTLPTGLLPAGRRTSESRAHSAAAVCGGGGAPSAGGNNLMVYPPHPMLNALNNLLQQPLSATYASHLPAHLPTFFARLPHHDVAVGAPAPFYAHAATPVAAACPPHGGGGARRAASSRAPSLGGGEPQSFRSSSMHSAGALLQGVSGGGIFGTGDFTLLQQQQLQQQQQQAGGGALTSMQPHHPHVSHQHHQRHSAMLVDAAAGAPAGALTSCHSAPAGDGRGFGVAHAACGGVEPSPSVGCGADSSSVSSCSRLDPSVPEEGWLAAVRCHEFWERRDKAAIPISPDLLRILDGELLEVGEWVERSMSVDGASISMGGASGGVGSQAEAPCGSREHATSGKQPPLEDGDACPPPPPPRATTGSLGSDATAAASRRPLLSAKGQLGRLRLTIKMEGSGGDAAGSPSKRRRQGECGTPTGTPTPTGSSAPPQNVFGQLQGPPCGAPGSALSPATIAAGPPDH